MPRVVISGYYGCLNSGDEAMLSAMIHDLRQRLGSVRFAVLSANPDGTEAEHDVEAVGRLDLVAIAHHLRRADLFITGGGSLLQDVTSWRNLYYQLILLNTAIRLSGKVMLYGHGIGPIACRMGWALTRRLLNRVDAITVRDKGSLALLESQGIRGEHVHLSADIALLHPHVPDPARGRELLGAHGAAGDRPVIAFSPRKWPGSDIEGVFVRAASLVQRGLGVDVALLPMQWPADGMLCMKIAQAMAHPAVTFDRPLSVTELLDVTAAVDLVVGMRLHSLVFAARTDTPMVAVAYDPKVSEFMRELGLDAVPVNDGIRLDELVLAVEKSWQNRSLIRDGILSARKELVVRAAVSGEVAARLLEVRA